MYNSYLDDLLYTNIYAHIKNDGNSLKKESLLEHMKLTYNYYLQMEEYKNLKTIVTNIIENMVNDNKLKSNTIEKVYDLFKAAIYYHDIGKINPNFQKDKMLNKEYKDIQGSTEHSLISARIYLDAFKRQIYDESANGQYSKQDATFLRYIIFYFSYIISRHHSNLSNLDNYLTKLSIVDIYDVYEVKFIETENNMLKNLDKVIYYLEAPTGSGKTNMAINLSCLLYKNIDEITSINYIFPFNTLVDQTKNTLRNYFKEYEDFIVINSCTSLVDEKEDILNYELAYIKSEFRQYDIKLTSHVNLFDILFGISKSSKYNLYDLANSVIVLDEIQAYSNKIWREIITLLIKYAKYLNIKIIIMSATLPRLDILLKDRNDEDICSLITNKNMYFENKIFKNRVKLDFSLLGKDNILNVLLNKIAEYKDKKVLVEFISKKSASNFYNMLKENKIENLYELTGDDNIYTREKIINLTKQEHPIVLVATQTIEAGVDIDMDIGFKDISYLDSEEQFLGRINRSSKKDNCIAYFFDFDDEEKIYKNDYRNEYTIRENNIRDILLNKDFESYYKLIMDKIYLNTEKYNSNNILNLYDSCKDLNFEGICNKLKLIDTNTIQVFLNYTLEINGEKIVGERIWENYKNIILNNEFTYAKKQIELSKIKPKLNLFIYQIYKYKNSNISYFDEEFGNIYYIRNGKEFVQDGKFNREKYISYTGGIFL